MSRLLKAVNKINQVPKNQEDSRSPAHPGNGQKKIKRHASVDSEAWVFQKKQSSRLFPHIGSLISSTKDIFPPRRCAGALARSHVPMGKPPLFARRRGRRRNAGDDGTREPRARDGSTKKNPSSSVRVSRRRNARRNARWTDIREVPSHHEPATTGIIIIIIHHRRESTRITRTSRKRRGNERALVVFPWTIARYDARES